MERREEFARGSTIPQFYFSITVQHMNMTLSKAPYSEEVICRCPVGMRVTLVDLNAAGAVHGYLRCTCHGA